MPVQRIEPSHALYPFQRRVLADLLDVLTAEGLTTNRRVVAHLPTGAGKTRIGCHVATAILNRGAADGQSVIWLSSTAELCEQAADGLATAWRHAGNRPASIYRFWGSGTADLAAVGEGFVVASLAKLWAANQREHGLLSAIGRRTAAVVFDEAHQAIAPTYRFIMEELATYDPPVLGLTATPGRQADWGDADYALARLFGETKVTIDPRGHANAVAYLTRQGYLADPEYIPVDVDTGAQIPDPGAGADYTQDDLDTLGLNPEWNRQVVDLATRALSRHRRVMVFCPSVRSSQHAASTLAASGSLAASITAGTDRAERERVIAAFRSGSPQRMALFNYGVLTAGFDAPATSCVIVARPTTSLVLYSQMVGRALRGPASGGNRRCQIYTVTDAAMRGFGSVIEAFTNWEDLWRHDSRV